MKEDLLRLLKDFIDYEHAKGFRRSSIDAKRRHIERFLKHIGYDLTRIIEDDLVIFLYTLKEHGMSPEKMNQVIAHIEQFCAYLMEHDVILFNPARWIERHRIVHSPCTGIFTEDEIRALLDASASTGSATGARANGSLVKRNKAILELLYSTGIRMSELVGLDVDDVDFNKGELLVRKGKNDKERIVPVGEEALKALNEYLVYRSRMMDSAKEYDALFLSREKHRLSVVALGRMIQLMKQRAGITAKGGSHALRKACASHMLQHGAPLVAIARMLGHERLVTTERYAEPHPPAPSPTGEGEVKAKVL